MEINKLFHEKVQKFVKQFNEFEDYELEARYIGSTESKKYVSKIEFDRCYNYVNSDEFEASDIDESLDIQVKYDDIQLKNDLKNVDYRITISGKQNIEDYCKSNLITSEVIIIQKEPIENLEFIDLDFRINLKHESVVSDPAYIIENLHSLDKSYRYKKRYSYTHPKDGVRIDLTVVKSAYGNYKRFTESNTVSKPEIYEIEVELLNRRVASSSSSSSSSSLLASTNIFLNQIFNLYRAITDEENFCSKKEKGTVLKEYLELCYPKEDYLKDYLLNPKKYFAGPQPITLERKNIVKAELGITTIRENYTVTEKADGERCLLYISKTGRCYFINSRLNVKFTGVILTSVKEATLLDGEYIFNDNLGNPIKYYAIFDAYWIDGKNILNLPLVGKTNSRIAAIEETLKKAKKKFEDEDIEIKIKEFLSGPDIFKEARKVLEKSNTGGFPYHIDGLIFTPMFLPVGAVYTDQVMERPVASWHMVFKWKPPEENTIDFLVNVKKGSANHPVMVFVDSIKYRIFNLYVGYNPASWKKITARAFLEGTIVKTNSYEKLAFRPSDIIDESITECFIKIGSQNDCLCKNGDEIEDDCIVEFKYDNTDDLPPFNRKWTPLRVRSDKTELYRKTKSLSNAVNDLGSALNVWKSIRAPVTEKMITGLEKIDTYEDKDDIYYDRKIKRDMFASKPMLDFHNDIKSLLILSNKSTSVLDLACGKGGDLNKYMNNNFTRIFGMDSSRDNIENPVDGAYARLNSRLHGKKSALKCVFLTMDLSKKINIKSIEDKDDRQVAEVIYGNLKDQNLKKYENLAKEKFELVSCQFAIHYFFESEIKLDAFLYNVDMNIKDGAIFIGTCLDGKLIKKLLQNTSVISGEVNKRVLWNIKKLYTKDIGVTYGEEIEVFMESIGRVMKEYLVNIDILEKKLKALGYEKIDNKNFKEFYNQETYPGLDEQQQKYSFLNMTFAFRKKSASEPKKRILKKKVSVEEEEVVA